VDIPDIKGISENDLIRSIKDFMLNKYGISAWDISVRVVKRGPSLRLTARESVGEWKPLD